MAIKFEFNSEQFEKALKDQPELLEKKLRRNSKNMASSVEFGAKRTHRFTTRTGRLVKSIKGYGGIGIPEDPSSAFVSLILHDEGHEVGTSYGKYVHNGQRSWGADRFIEESMQRNHKKILKAWQQAIYAANKEF
jgi:hypothetical protein